MSISLFDAANSRWVAAGLVDSISGLRLDVEGGPEGMIKSMSTGTRGPSAPANEGLPRSRFAEAEAEVEVVTSTSKIYRQMLLLTCYSKRLSDIKNYQDLIIENFENSHLFSSDPFALADGEGCIIGIDYDDMQKSPLDAELKYVELAFCCRYVVPRVMPS